MSSFAGINERRRLDRISRFRDPEYWPFSSAGEKITSVTDNINVIYEPFDEPLIEKPPVGRALTTDFDSVSEQNEWAIQNLSGSLTVSLTFVADPVPGAARGRVMKITNTGASSNVPVARVYPASGTVKGASILGIRNGRVKLYYRTTTNSDFTTFRLRFREKDANNYYEFSLTFVSGGGGSSPQVRKVVAGVSQNIDIWTTTGFGGQIVRDSTWHWIEWTWWEGTDQYGTRLYIQCQTDFGVDTYVPSTGSSGNRIRDWFVDTSPSFSNETATTISIIKDANGGSSGTIHVDDITLERWG